MICKDTQDEKPLQRENKLDRKGDKSRWTEKEHIKQSEPQKTGGRPAGELEKAVGFFVGVYESAWREGG